jgi:hypothetical protein
VADDGIAAKASRPAARRRDLDVMNLPFEFIPVRASQGTPLNSSPNP